MAGRYRVPARFVNDAHVRSAAIDPAAARSGAHQVAAGGRTETKIGAFRGLTGACESPVRCGQYPGLVSRRGGDDKKDPGTRLSPARKAACTTLSIAPSTHAGEVNLARPA